MHLKHIKLCGFKSFVDSTTVSVPAQLVGIVGPNGCGKSNVIDAIRWVMGESSAKTLRGDSMDDVIFNGSSTRKPVSKAWVELVFDNSDGTAPGNYARFNELAIRRELIREGAASTYFINKTRCRRKDIHDIFLGTGLGPRSYSIIEQGMVGRVVESRPEELRVLIEEAAGISKYKERRRETENRIRRTRDNLSRVQDILQELGSQLRRLKRQSNAAARYKGLKEQQRELTLQLHTVRWRDLEAHVRHHELEMARLQTEYEARIADQREAERSIEEMRVQHSDLTEELQPGTGRVLRGRRGDCDAGTGYTACPGDADRPVGGARKAGRIREGVEATSRIRFCAITGSRGGASGLLAACRDRLQGLRGGGRDAGACRQDI